MKVLVIEDSERLLRSLGRGLKREGYAVDLVADGRDGWDYARLNDYDIIILDLLLPSMDGLTILRNLRASGKQTHVLILSARDQVEDRVRGLQLGADDYMVKPFSFDELCARIHTLVRRRYAAKNPTLTLGPLTLNTATREVRRGDKVVPLTPGEYGILEHLALNRGNVLSKEQLLEALHDSDSYAGTNVLEVMVCNLRKKIDRAGEPSIVQTRRGYGYFVPE
jgi:DNA-binding response OmpR family regulator